MNSLPSLYHPPAVHDSSVASTTSSAAQATTVGVPAIEDVGAAANDDVAAATSGTANPLWIIVAAAACFFGFVAAVIAMG